MGKIQYLSICVLLNILYVKGLTYTSVIQTASGPVQGFISKTIENIDYAAFKGIRFAKAPLGYLRFKPPAEVDPWTDVYNATMDGNFCTQVPIFGNVVTGSEDCLFINVYTPHITFDTSTSKAVMVYIYGGGYGTGDSRQSSFGPDYIVGKDVILVTFNYRLGPLGFLNLGHENATGNCALKDQNMALRWTKRNIANFGGDPDKITIFGQSAGASAVDLQVLSDMSSGLFSRSIAMSGSTLCLYWGIQRRNDALLEAFNLGIKLGTVTTSKDVLLQTLYKASAASIVVGGRDAGILAFRPTIENPNIAINEEKFLTKCSVTKYQTGNYTKIPHMLGFTNDEPMSFVRSVDNLFNSTESALTILKKIPFLSNIVSAITHGIENLSVDALIELSKKLSDIFFALGIDTRQRLISRNNDYPVYYYRFSFSPNNSAPIIIPGAAHSDDLAYVLYRPSANISLNDPDVISTRQKMVELYTNFAKFGNPTPYGNDDPILGITWPDSRPNGDHLEIGKVLTTGPRPTNKFIETLQLLGLGSSHFLNDCE